MDIGVLFLDLKEKSTAIFIDTPIISLA